MQGAAAPPAFSRHLLQIHILTDNTQGKCSLSENWGYAPPSTIFLNFTPYVSYKFFHRLFNIRLVWLLFIAFTFLHLYSNYKAVSAVVMETVNLPRLHILVERYMNSSVILTPKEVAKLDPVIRGKTCFLIPHSCHSCSRRSSSRSRRSSYSCTRRSSYLQSSSFSFVYCPRSVLCKNVGKPCHFAPHVIVPVVLCSCIVFMCRVGKHVL